MAARTSTPARPFLIAGSAGMTVGFIFLFAGILDAGSVQWFTAHGMALTAGWILPGLYGLHVHTAARFGHPLDPADTRRAADLTLLGAALLSFGHLLQPSGTFALVAFAGVIVLTIGGVILSKAVMVAAPKGSVVTDDPLTKGDDACWKHIVFAHRFLPIGLALWAFSYLPFIGASVWVPRLGLTGVHILLIGYGLLSLYGLGHIWVPRFSGVPAIAAGAIKGELHTTLLGIVGMSAGFLFALPGLIIGFGPFVFLGFFTYMGVLGANIMRNKSVTHRVTPQYVYVPWTFAGIFWLVSGVLLGLFLNVVPDALAAQAPGLRWIHIHINLFGGFILLLMGWSTRIFPDLHGEEPPVFAGAMRAAFLLLNIALLIGAIAILQGPPTSDLFVSAGLLSVLGLLFYGVAMRGFMSSRASAQMP